MFLFNELLAVCVYGNSTLCALLGKNETNMYLD